MIQEYLSMLFEEHGVSCTVRDEWIVPDGEFAAIRAQWYPEQVSGGLEVQILVGENVVIDDSFAGIGERNAGLKDALGNFTISIFHVLLAALWGNNEAQQVVAEDWDVNGNRYTAYIGNFIIRAYESIQPEIPSELFTRLQQAIQSESLNGDIHWFRLFLANLKGEFTYEARKDNEDWEPGVLCLESVSLPRSEGYYGIRLFIILRVCI